MGPILNSLAEFIVSGKGVLIWCIVTILIALVCYIWFFLKIHASIKLLKSSISEISSFETIKDFAAGFTEFEDRIVVKKPMVHLWREFRKTLVFPVNTIEDGDIGVIVKTQDPSWYFNEQNIIGSKINLSFYRAVPNILTGLGILGTFLGLGCGIYLANKGLTNFTNYVELNTSLGNLLHGASLAFVTSIIGLFFSILFLGAKKYNIQSLHKVINEWNENLNERLDGNIPDLGQKQLKELEKQTRQLEQFNELVVFNIAEALDQRMADRLGPTLETLVNEIKGLREDRGHTNEQLLIEIVEEFKNTISLLPQNSVGSDHL